MLKFIMEPEAMEGVADDVKSLYSETQNGDKTVFVLTGIEGTVSKSKVDEFRDNNIALTEKVKAFGEWTPEAIAELQSKHDEQAIQLENAGKVDEVTVNNLVEKRVATMRDEYETKEKNLVNTNNELTSKLNDIMITGDVHKASVKHKVSPSGMTDVLLRAKTVFKMEDGRHVAYDEYGEKQYGPDGTTPLTVDDWVKSLIKTSPHLFEASVTGGLKDGKKPGFKGDTSKMKPMDKISHGLSS